MEVFGLALDFLEFADRIESAVRRRKRWLNDDFQAASVSILANVGEGATELSVKDKKRFYRYAVRSTGECSALLHGIERLRLIPPPDVEAGKAILLSLRIHLLRLLRFVPPRPRTPAPPPLAPPPPAHPHHPATPTPDPPHRSRAQPALSRRPPGRRISRRAQRPNF